MGPSKKKKSQWQMHLLRPSNAQLTYFSKLPRALASKRQATASSGGFPLQRATPNTFVTSTRTTKSLPPVSDQNVKEHGTNHAFVKEEAVND
jgi:hypothetical protein